VLIGRIVALSDAYVRATATVIALHVSVAASASNSAPTEDCGNPIMHETGL
jgi:hypothetical protein